MAFLVLFFSQMTLKNHKNLSLSLLSANSTGRAPQSWRTSQQGHLSYRSMLWTLMRVPMGRSRTASCTKTRLCLRSVFTQTQVLKTLFSLLLTLIHRTDWCTCYLLLVPVCLSATVPQALSCSPLKLSNSLWLINHDSDANISHKLLFMLCDFCFAFICCFTLSCSYISIYPSCSFCCTARWPLVCLIHFPVLGLCRSHGDSKKVRPWTSAWVRCNSHSHRPSGWPADRYLSAQHFYPGRERQQS